MDYILKADTIQALSNLLLEHYVFPETAEKMSEEIIRRMNDCEYEGVEDLSSFAKLVTSQLQAISQDRHLQIRHQEQERQAETTEKEQKVQQDCYLAMLKADNYGFAKIERLAGNIGLLEFRVFAPPEHAGETASSAMTFLANTNGMIIDLRQNFGGSAHMVAFLASYLLEPPPVHLNDLYWRNKDEIQQYWSLPYVPGRRYGGSKPLYILTSRKTFSAAEEFAYNLQAIGRAVIVGERTGGGAHPGKTYRINRAFDVFIPNGRAINPVTGGNWEGAGVRPDIEVPQERAFHTAYTMLLESEWKRLADQPPAAYKRLLDEIKQELKKNDIFA
ncbi:hypothetical protein PAESOLCIP111_05337 [Paenibacillus solanacearum]|uniref:Tail specific protease domain-containing protein n=1 Tax=Paenibacillus solanacearum TaxID=2048548 RepID=A0A916NS37_9BACL|nr:S41 family peptidase [Paenibacillus solanacearum]CAG7647204.1 hypothetical protein PAESOLCIP111_05337 [Paenibacillus solanacearum]